MSSFEERKQAFKDSCKMFRWEIEEYNELQMRNALSRVDKQTLSFMKEDIDYVQKKFDTLKKEYGFVAFTIMWLYYIEGKTKKEIAEQFDIPRNRVAKYINKVEHALFQ